MKNRLMCVAMAAFFAIGIISCGKPVKSEDFLITAENVDNYIVSLGNYEGLTVEASKDELTDELVEYYADYYYSDLASKTEGMTDEEGNPVPMTDEAIQMLNSAVFSTVNEFMVFVRNTVKDFLEYSYENQILQGVVDQVCESSEFNELPKELIAKEKAYINEKFSDVAASYGIDIDDYLKCCGTSMEELANEYAKEEIVLYKIAISEGFESEDKEAMKEKLTEYMVGVTNVEPQSD